MRKLSKNYQGCSLEKQEYFGKLKFTNKEELKKIIKSAVLKNNCTLENRNSQVRKNSKNYQECSCLQEAAVVWYLNISGCLNYIYKT
jgi:hypothetical protein